MDEAYFYQTNECMSDLSTRIFYDDGFIESSETVLKKDGQMMIAFQKGKGEKDAVRMYTDWKRLRMAYKEEEGWSGLIQPISGMIEPFDCAINATPVEALGCYVDKAFYEEFINK